MVSARAHAAFELLAPERTSRDPSADAAITTLLDHLAEELAREYVHLMEKAAGDECLADPALRDRR